MSSGEQEYTPPDGDVAALAGAVVTGPGLPGITTGSPVRWEGGGHAACDTQIDRLTAELACARSAAASDRGRAKSAEAKLAAVRAYCERGAWMPEAVNVKKRILAIISGREADSD